jgi:beta-N-acetylhexosaminidase
MRGLWRILNLLIMAALVLSTALTAVAQEGGEEAFIAGLLPKLSPEAKIGQLFIVGFDGTEVAGNTDIADLLRAYQVGGVLLSTENGNIGTGPDTPVQVAGLTTRLQNAARSARTATAAPFIPLFTALRQDGDGAPNSEILSGLTPAPSYMAQGATWSTANTEANGAVVGQELAALGVNLLLGPVLDVRPDPSTTIFDPSVNVFGGDPYWVGVLGAAYARGLQTGSQGRLAVTAKSFPGQGSLDDASFTIDRSLDDLEKIDLPPFVQAMLSPNGKGRPLADALLITNVRYRGFSGNIRERTAPISLDGAALQTLLGLPDVKAWRDNGGLLISDAPGSVMARDYYSTTSSGSISVTQAALESFQAGNDLLILDGLRPGSIDGAAAIRDVISAFRQKYSTDPVFQQRVDSAVQRILRLKYRLYPDYDFTQVAVPVDQIRANLNSGSAVVSEVAQNATTLLWPAADELTAVQPGPDDTMLILADVRTVRECPTCVPQPTLNAGELARSISQVYGLPPANITTTTYSELKAFLQGREGALDLTPTFGSVPWIVVAQQALTPAHGDADAVQLLLDQRPDLVADKRLIGFLFGPPYGFTAKQIERFTALYALYGKLTPNIEVAVEALAGERPPAGRSPVNLTALDYDLTRQTEPDPGQVISLAVGDLAAPGQPTLAPAALRAGDTMRLRTGVIVDRNGHPVPDGTPVRFYFQYDGETAPTIQESKTSNGVALTEFVLSNVGRLLIHATSEPALDSIGLQITISESGAIVATVAPTPTPTPTRLPTLTPTASATPTITPTPTPPALETFLTRKTQNAPWGELLLTLTGIALLGGGGYWLIRQRQNDLSDALRAALWTAIGGLLGYVYFSLGLPGSEVLRAIFGGFAPVLMALLGGAIPLLYQLRR